MGPTSPALLLGAPYCSAPAWPGAVLLRLSPSLYLSHMGLPALPTPQAMAGAGSSDKQGFSLPILIWSGDITASCLRMHFSKHLLQVAFLMMQAN